MSGEVVGATLGEFGDVEFLVVRLDGDHLSPSVLEVLLRQVDFGVLRLLDTVLVRRHSSDEFSLTEVDDGEFALAGLDMHAPGLVCEDDIRHFAAALPIGSLALLILVEPMWARQFSADLSFRGGAILASQPIPASVANSVVGAAMRHR